MSDPGRCDGPAAARCPRCGGDNHCAMASGARDASDCWCRRVPFAAAALAGLPTQASCVCQACATAPPAPSPAPAPARGS